MREKSSKKDFVKDFKNRTKKFAVDIINFCQTIPKSREGRIIADQLIRSGTSVGSNYRAACRARSRKEFYAKMCIVVEEADEVLFWLQVINGSKIKEGKKLTILLKEAEEILSIVATARKTAGSNLE